MNKRCHLRVGDLLVNPFLPVMGLITKVTKEYIHFYLMGRDDLGESFTIEERARKSAIYMHIDAGKLDVHLGSKERRRKITS